ncbi:MAG: hypothetical protein ACON4U_11175 [Myxococcota bacterium]
MKNSPFSSHRVNLAGDRLLSAKTQPFEGQPVGVPTSDTDLEHTLSSGHRLTIEQGNSEVIIESPNGDANVRIIFTDNHPVIELQSASLRLHSIEDIDVSCKRYRLNAEETADFHSDGTMTIDSRQELKLTSKDDVRVDGKVIWLN